MKDKLFSLKTVLSIHAFSDLLCSGVILLLFNKKNLKMSTRDVKIPDYVKFIFGGSAGLVVFIIRIKNLFLYNIVQRMGATLFVQPLDLVKNRMQLSG